MAGCLMEYVICFRCWETVEKTGRNQKFCSDCGIKVRYIKDKYKKRRQRDLGTSDFFGHAYKDFGREWDAIQREKRKLGLFF